MTITSAEPALSFEAVEKIYANATVALRNVSFAVECGAFFGLLGPNGAGKSTLIACLAGLAKPTSGRIFVHGIDCAHERRRASACLGVVPQEIVFDPFLTVRETLRFQSGYWGIRRNDDWIDEILANLDLTDKADTNMRALSGGMKRRVLVAQALVHRPPVVVLDEPTAGVDVALRENLWRFIGRLHQSGTTVVLTTHDLAEAQRLCRRIAILKKGEIVAIDQTEALLQRFEGSVLRCRLVQGDLPPELAADLIRRHGADVVMRVRNAADAAHKLDVLRRCGIAVENLTLSQPSLEDAFLTIAQSEE